MSKKPATPKAKMAHDTTQLRGRIELNPIQATIAMPEQGNTVASWPPSVYKFDPGL